MGLLTLLLIAAIILLLVFQFAATTPLWFWLGFGAVVAALVVAFTGDRRIG